MSVCSLPVKVGIRGSVNIKISTADVIDCLIIDHKSAVGVLQGGVGCQDGVVRFNYSSGHLEIVILLIFSLFILVDLFLSVIRAISTIFSYLIKSCNLILSVFLTLIEIFSLSFFLYFFTIILPLFFSSSLLHPLSFSVCFFSILPSLFLT